MAKKSATKKAASTAGTTTIPAPPSPLELLILSLRATADELTRLTPVLNPAESSVEIHQLSQQLETALTALRSKSLLSLEEFASLQPAWTEVWTLAKTILLSKTTEVVGPINSPPKKDIDFCQKALVAVLQKGGKELAIKLAEQAKSEWTEQLANNKPALTSHVSDKEANEHLKAWGKLSETDFLSRYTQIDDKLLQRAGQLVGLKINAKSTTAKRKEFYKKAHRFAVNTAA